MVIYVLMIVDLVFSFCL
uniref:Uncharacterized protein n=1 Tax=Rhizophora mucronata TaxID=61149 RepID=A0A2P2IQ07_RHIMU